MIEEHASVPDLRFNAKLEWSGGRTGWGSIDSAGQLIEFSVPASMGGRGQGTDPEGLFASAVGACYAATLAGVLDAARLPHTGLRLGVEALVTDHGKPSARIARVQVTLTVIGGDLSQHDQYIASAQQARRRCFIGRHIHPEIAYEVVDVSVLSEEAPSEALDVRRIPPPRRHQLIFNTLDKLAPGEEITLINDHDPLPLRYQLEATRGGAYSWRYLEEGPIDWRVAIGRRS